MNDEFKKLDATILLSQPTPEATGIDSQSSGNEEDMFITDYQARFQFIDYVAAGGMGQIGRAKDVAFGRFVAIKSLRGEHLNDPLQTKAFLAECRLNAQLDHPSIVPVYTMGKSKSGNSEVVMKLIHGTSLAKFIRLARTAYTDKAVNLRQEQYALSSRLEYFLKICEVIDYCHSRKIIHGDLKPDNIMIGHFGEVYVMDWGCSRPIGTVPEHITGTPSYLPPEFLKDHRITPQIDIYSLGMLLFKLVTLQNGKGRMKEDIDKLENRHYHARIKVRPEIKAIIDKALNPDPHRRYHSVKELSSDVRHFIYSEEVSAYPENLYRKSLRWISHNRMKSMLAVFSLIGILCLLQFYSYYQVNLIKQHRKDLLMERTQFQQVEDDLAGELDRSFLLAQGKVMMFADNLTEYAGIPPDYSKRFYDNDDYKNPATQPPMKMTEYYHNPISVDNMVRFPIQGSMAGMLGAKQFIYICNKIISLKINSYDATQVSGKQLLSPECVIQRLMVYWANGVEYSYPGTYDDPAAPAYQWRWDDPDIHNREKKTSWGLPYHASIAGHRLVCRYPMFDSDNKYLGIAAIEFRLENLLIPLFREHPVTPGSHYFIVAPTGTRIAELDGREITLIDRDQIFPDGVKAAEIVDIARRLTQSDFRQFEVILNNRLCVVSGTRLSTIDVVFLQINETKLN